MTMKPWNAGLLSALCVAMAVQPDMAYPARNKEVKKMEFQKFAEKMKDKDSFELTVAGTAHQSFFTGKTYLHYETVAFSGRDDIRSTHQILYHTQADFTVLHGAVAVPLQYSQVRTCLGPSFERKYRKEELADPKSEKDKSLSRILNDGDAEALLLVEYGLEAGKKYHGRIKTESYHLPPRERDGMPERRNKTVIVISDRAFPNDCELTPLYKGWSY